MIRVEGRDFRQRNFSAHPDRDPFVGPAQLDRLEAGAGARTLRVGFRELLDALASVHPIHYAALVDGLDALLIDGLEPFERLPEALRWVHFIDKLYDAAVPLAATSTSPLGALFPKSFLDGPFAKKFSRCHSRLAELLGENVARAVHAAGGPGLE